MIATFGQNVLIVLGILGALAGGVMLAGLLVSILFDLLDTFEIHHVWLLVFVGVVLGAAALMTWLPLMPRVPR